MSAYSLMPGDRVRFLDRQRLNRFGRGDKGAVAVGPYHLGVRRYYLVVTDGDTREALAVFTEDELEPDLGRGVSVA
jgi:hypothetical protein